jgi:hypothetical protein
VIPASSPDILNLVHISKEMKQMNPKKALTLTVCVMLAVACFAQGKRGLAELKAGSSSITIDYGQPALKGRDMLSQLAVGSFWRMGSNTSTTLKTPVNLAFGAIKVPAGAYSLWLKRTEQEKFSLVFNSQTGEWGMNHDVSKDVYQVPMKKEALPSPVEVFTVDLKEAPKGGVIILNWGTTALSADFQFAK